MKKFFICILFVFSCLMSYSQPQDTIYVLPKTAYSYVQSNYFEFGLGALIPTDESNSYTAFDLEVGRYINDYVGLGLNFKYGSEDEYKDRLGYIGPKVRFRICNINEFESDIHIGFGYGWYTYRDWYDDWYYNNRTLNYVVPNIGISGYIKMSRNISLGIEPSYFWYISTNKDESTNVGVWNVMGKIKFNF